MSLPSLDAAIWSQLGLTLVHFVWQGAGLAVLLAIALWLLRRRTPRERYAACAVALLAMAVSPVATFCWLDAPDTPTSATAFRASPNDTSVTLVPSPGPVAPIASAETHALPSSGAVVPDSAATDNTPALSTVAQRSSVPAVIRDHVLTNWLSYAAFVWIVIVVLLGARLLVGWLSLGRLRRDVSQLPETLVSVSARLAKRLGVSENVRVMASGRVREPIAFGVLRPLVLVPASLLGECRADVLEAMIAHELAHIRRHDLWLNIAQRLVETLLFYHPAVWWVSGRMRLERELCCDDLAVSVTGRRETYARALLEVTQAARTPTLALAASMFSPRISLRDRIRRILQLPSAPQRGRLWPAGALALLLAGSLLAVAPIDVSPEHGEASSTGPQGSPPTDAADVAESHAPTGSDPPPRMSIVGTDYEFIDGYVDDIAFQNELLNNATSILKGYLAFALAVQRGDDRELQNRFRPMGERATHEQLEQLRRDLGKLGFEMGGGQLSADWAATSIVFPKGLDIGLVAAPVSHVRYHERDWNMQTMFVLVPSDELGWVVERVAYGRARRFELLRQCLAERNLGRTEGRILVYELRLFGGRPKSWGQASLSWQPDHQDRIELVVAHDPKDWSWAMPTRRDFEQRLQQIDLYAPAGLATALTEPEQPVAVKRSVPIYAPADGIVSRVSVEPGQQVKKGELLVRLDDAEIAIELEAAQIRRANAGQELELLRRLHDIGRLAGEAELLRAETTANLAAMEVQRWQLRLERTRIVAPADGIVDSLAKGLAAGKKVTAGDEVAKLNVPAATPGNADQENDTAQPER